MAETLLQAQPGLESAAVGHSTLLKDTVDDFASLDVAFLAEMQLDEFPEAAGVVVVHGLGVPEGLHDGTVEGRRDVIINQANN